MNKLRQSARGESCTVWLPGCLSTTDTTVLAHAPSKSGMGKKSPDWWAAYACYQCHDYLDGRRKWQWPFLPKSQAWMDAIRRTQKRMHEKGLLKT